MINVPGVIYDFINGFSARVQQIPPIRNSKNSKIVRLEAATFVMIRIKTMPTVINGLMSFSQPFVFVLLNTCHLQEGVGDVFIACKIFRIS